jgi:plasmid maintenance system antidote protein VapI
MYGLFCAPTKRLPPKKSSSYNDEMDVEAERVVGERVRDLRIERGVSLRKFALENDFNPNVISRIERGDHNITLETLLRLSRALKTTPAELLRGIT